MNIVGRLLRLLLPFWWLVLLAGLLVSLTIASNMGLLSLAAYLIAASAFAPLIGALMIPIYGVRLFGVTRAVMRYAERLVSHDVTFRLLARLRIAVFNRLEVLAPSSLFVERSGDMLTRLVSDVEELQTFYLNLLAPLLSWLFIVALTGGLFALFSPRLSVVAMALLVVAGLAIPLGVGLLTRDTGKQALAGRAALKAQLVDAVQGMRDLLACSAGAAQLKKLADLDGVLGRTQRRMAQVTGLQVALNESVANLSLWVILVLAIPLVSGGKIGGVYLAFLALLMLASFECVPPLAQCLQFLGHSRAAGARLLAAIERQPTVPSTGEPLPGGIVGATAKHTLTFEQVHFAYGPDEAEVVRDISFCLRPGQRIALVGPSGAGKSTVMRLVLRFWDCTQGTILLDGQDVRRYAPDEVRTLYSVVAQDTYLFHDTIRGNLLLARPTATEDELARVIEQVGLAAYVQGLPEKLDTLIGEQGVKLSGGERQRLAIARALLRDAPVLLLDEATAHLDPLTEREVLDALDVLMRDRTTLLATHRLVAMERMDEILVLDGGRVVERGTHAQLVQANGLYKQLFDMQNDFLSLA